MDYKIGDKVGSLTIIAASDERAPHGSKKWLVKCDCGNTITRELRTPTAKSTCGNCVPSHRQNTYYMRHRLRKLWQAMHSRCYSEKYHNAQLYADIEVCAEWHDFNAYREWALANGYQDHLSIDRIDPDGHYEPRNCRWITVSENSKRVRRKLSLRNVEHIIEQAKLGTNPFDILRGL